MDDFSRNLGSLSWWLGVVVVGLVLNLVSAYLKAPFDRLFSAASSRWNRRSELVRTEEAKKVAELRNDHEARNHLFAEEIRCRLRHLSLLLLAVFVLLFYVMIRVRVPSSALLATDPVLFWWSKGFYYGSLMIMFFAIQQHFRAMSYRRLLHAANHPPKG